jgi:hypothetical protein
MGDQPYTEEDVQRAAGAVHRAASGCEIEHKARHNDEDEEIARAVLGVLAEAGRLLPPDEHREIFKTWYRSLTPDGGLWCESSNPAEVREMTTGDGYTFQKLDVVTVRTGWRPWVGVPQQDEETAK